MMSEHDDKDISQVISSVFGLKNVAPDFDAISTRGKIKLSDFRGKWVILFSHPGDFTPICTTEIIEFARRYDEFKKRNTELIGLSVDSIHAHLAWIEWIEKTTGVKVEFPIIADQNMKISRLYGMIHGEVSSAFTVRSTYIIDPSGVIRVILHYPLNVGRNIDELLRLIDALQTADKHNVLIPANWTPEKAVLAPPPSDIDTLRKLTKDKKEMDWLLCEKKLRNEK